MSNVYDFESHDRGLDEASVWIARLDRGLTAAEQEELRMFLEDPNARSQFLALAEHWDKLDSLSRLSDIMPPVAQRKSGWAWKLSAAAAVVVALAAGLYVLRDDTLVSPPPPGASLALYETAVGEQFILNLNDGTTVALNTDSRMSVVFSANGRLVVLDHGEAHFEVAEDPYRPFSVLAGGTLFQAVGTEFSIHVSGPEDIELIVVEGAVRVDTQDHGIKTGALEPPGLMPSGDTVAAGSICLFDADTKRIDAIDVDDIEMKLSWRRGNLVFTGETLETVMQEISRYTELEFVFLDETSKRVTVAGLFRAGDVEGLLETLRANFGIAYQRTDDGKVLLSGR